MLKGEFCELALLGHRATCTDCVRRERSIESEWSYSIILKSNTSNYLCVYSQISSELHCSMSDLAREFFHHFNLGRPPKKKSSRASVNIFIAERTTFHVVITWGIHSLRTSTLGRYHHRISCPVWESLHIGADIRNGGWGGHRTGHSLDSQSIIMRVLHGISILKVIKCTRKWMYTTEEWADRYNACTFCNEYTGKIFTSHYRENKGRGGKWMILVCKSKFSCEDWDLDLLNFLLRTMPSLQIDLVYRLTPPIV